MLSGEEKETFLPSHVRAALRVFQCVSGCSDSRRSSSLSRSHVKTLQKRTWSPDFGSMSHWPIAPRSEGCERAVCVWGSFLALLYGLGFAAALALAGDLVVIAAACCAMTCNPLVRSAVSFSLSTHHWKAETIPHSSPAPFSSSLPPSPAPRFGRNRPSRPARL